PGPRARATRSPSRLTASSSVFELPPSTPSTTSTGGAERTSPWLGGAFVGGKPPRCQTGEAMTLNLEALETSFDLVAPRGDELMDVFYARLFATAPAVKPLFARADLKKQKTMLLGTLVLLRKSLRDLDAIVPKLHELGARHVAYGARPEHYPVVGGV